MKKINQIEISGRKFYFEEDALATLESYINRIKELYRDNGEEFKVAEVENRIAEMCHNRVGEKGIVTALLIGEAINSIGIQVETTQNEAPQADDAAQEATTATEPKDESDEPWYRAMLLGNRIYRNAHDSYLGGVLSGLAAYFGTSTALLRILSFLLFFIEPVGTALFFVYIALWMIFPKATSIIDYTRMRRVSTKDGEESVRAMWKQNYERSMQELAQPPANGCLPTLVKLLFFIFATFLMVPIGIMLIAIIVMPLTFFGLFLQGNIAGLVSLPFVVMAISIVVTIAIILFAIIYWILKKFSVCKPMKRWAKATLIVLLLTSLTFAGLSTYRTLTQYGGGNIAEMIETGFTDLLSPEGISKYFLNGSRKTVTGWFYNTHQPVAVTGDKVFASLWGPHEGLYNIPLVIETLHNDKGEYDIYFYHHNGPIDEIDRKIADKRYDARYTINGDVIHGNLYFIWNNADNTLYIDEIYEIPDGTRNSTTVHSSETLQIGDIEHDGEFNFGNAGEKGLETFSIFFYGQQRTPSLLVGGNSNSDGREIEPSSTYTHIKSPLQVQKSMATTIKDDGTKDTVNISTSITVDKKMMHKTIDDLKKIGKTADSIINGAHGIIDVDYSVTE